MDQFDFRPKFSPIVDSASYRYSIGAYRGRKRIILAWFADELPANDYLVRCRRDYPRVKFDCLRSLF